MTYTIAPSELVWVMKEQLRHVPSGFVRTACRFLPSLPISPFTSNLVSSYIRAGFTNGPSSNCFHSFQWGTEPATNPVALVSDLSTRKVVFCVLRSGTNATCECEASLPLFNCRFWDVKITNSKLNRHDFDSQCSLGI